MALSPSLPFFLLRHVIDPSLAASSSFSLLCNFSFSPAQTHFITLKAAAPAFPSHSVSHDFVFSSLFLSISFCSLRALRTCRWMVRGPEGDIISRNTSLLSRLWGRTRQTRPKQSPQLAPEKPWLGVCGPLPSSARLVETSRRTVRRRTGSLRGLLTKHQTILHCKEKEKLT